ncbi:MAG: hemerythrin domain-containing protein [Burkholderiaceae bacterium]
MASHIAFPGFGSPAAGPDAPLQMLEACHQRMQRQCATLRRLVAHLPAHGSDTQAREAAQAVMRYFDISAPQHHADEEADLLPALQEAMAGSDAVCIRGMAQRLAEEHRQLESAWERLRPALESIAAGQSSPLSADDAESFVEATLSHLAYEESEVLPMAERLLLDDQLQQIGQAMAARRGLKS